MGGQITDQSYQKQTSRSRKVEEHFLIEKVSTNGEMVEKHPGSINCMNGVGLQVLIQ